MGELKPQYLVLFIAEVIGTGLLLFLGCMGGCNIYENEPQPTHHFAGITFGLTVMLVIQIFGHISGAHLNPAVTIAAVLYGLLTPLMGIVYILAQFVGATLGFGLLKILADSYTPDNFCATTVNPKLSVFQALGIEIVITSVLIIVCCAVWDKRNSDKQDSVALRFGFVIAAISMAAGPLTGASMNTARSFAPLVFGSDWKNHWIYWVGPNLAALIAVGIYKFIFSVPDKEAAKRDNLYLDEIQTGDKI